MRPNKFKKSSRLLILLAAGMVMASPSFALDVNLAAVEGTWTRPDTGTDVTMWGFIQDPGSCPGAPVAWDVGPEISATAGDVLNINLRNCLTEPISIVIPGQLATMTPTWTDNSTGNRTSSAQRVRSFTHETAPNTVGAYTWNSVRAGTYLYESGTHPALHVPMGLYGALKVDAAAGMAYTGIPYDSEVVLLYSEIDPALHDPTPTTANPRNYSPSYFLVNGQPFVSGSTAGKYAGAPGGITLMRLLNATLRDTVPTINGTNWDIVAEDGNPYPYPRKQNTALMPAGKTRDVILNTSNSGNFQVFDRRLGLTNGLDSNGGLFTVLDITTLPAGVLGIFNNGTWTIDSNGNGVLDAGVDTTFTFGGLPGDLPVTGDWDNDGITEMGIYRSGAWYLDSNDNGLWDGPITDTRYNLGLAGDLPVSGDWDGDGASEIGVYRNGTWYLDLNGNGIWDGPATDARYIFGQAGDLPVTGDWDGNGTAEIGIFRNGTWFIDLNGNGVWNGPATDARYTFGTVAGDLPVTGDWDNTGTARIGVFRSGTWYLDINGNGAWDGLASDARFTFGQAGDTPVNLGAK